MMPLEPLPITLRAISAEAYLASFWKEEQRYQTWISDFGLVSHLVHRRSPLPLGYGKCLSSCLHDWAQTDSDFR
jgi:hypothetical protein